MQQNCSPASCVQTGCCTSLTSHREQPTLSLFFVSFFSLVFYIFFRFSKIVRSVSVAFSIIDTLTFWPFLVLLCFCFVFSVTEVWQRAWDEVIVSSKLHETLQKLSDKLLWLTGLKAPTN